MEQRVRLRPVGRSPLRMVTHGPPFLLPEPASAEEQDIGTGQEIKQFIVSAVQQAVQVYSDGDVERGGASVEIADFAALPAQIDTAPLVQLPQSGGGTHNPWQRPQNHNNFLPRHVCMFPLPINF